MTDYRKFMDKHSLIWKKMPLEWHEGPFMGNGMLGIYICKEKEGKRLKIEMGRNDVCGHIKQDRVRLPIGYFAFETIGDIISTDMKLDIYNAETTGKITTDKGTVEFRSFVHAEKMVFICETKAFGEEKNFKFEWVPAIAENPRHAWGVKHNSDYMLVEDYKPNPKPFITEENDIHLCIQKLLGGGKTVTAWKIKEENDTKTFYATVTHSYPGEEATDEAKMHIEDAYNAEKLFNSHILWWNEYYKKSFLTIPDGKLESFYWIQLYKIASATRANFGIVDNQGPWLSETAWPGIWFNLNVQLAYSPLYTSNHLDIGESLLNHLVSKMENLINNVPEEYRYDSAGIATATSIDLISPVGIPGIYKGGFLELGNLTWVMHNCFMHYKMSMDRKILDEVVYPILRRTINYYLHFLYKDENGKYNLPETSSPEYGGVHKNCNYDLSLIKWGTKTLIYICDKLKIKDELIYKWQDVYDNLIDYPKNEDGYMIGENSPYAKSHRHYSHLLMIYPLYLVNADNKEDIEIIRKSLLHWQSMPEQLLGYSYTGASSISSAINDGDSALSYLMGLFGKFLKANTMYMESGPVIETPLAAAQSIHDMLLQSHNDKIRIFPAVPSVWKDVAFENLRAEGGFLVSAKMKNSECEHFRIKSLAGEPCVIKIKGIRDFEIICERELEIKYQSEEIAVVDLKKDEEVIFAKKGITDFEITPVETLPETHNSFGLK